MEFNLICNVCKQKVSNPFEHLRTYHKPLEFFTLMPQMDWSDLQAEPKTTKKVVEEYTGVKLPKKAEPVEVEEAYEEADVFHRIARTIIKIVAIRPINIDSLSLI